MIKKNDLSQGDKKAWKDYIENPNDVYDKDNSKADNINRKDRFKFNKLYFTRYSSNN